jgi:hypothetical protein
VIIAACWSALKTRVIVMRPAFMMRSQVKSAVTSAADVSTLSAKRDSSQYLHQNSQMRQCARRECGEGKQRAPHANERQRTSSQGPSSEGCAAM